MAMMSRTSHIPQHDIGEYLGLEITSFLPYSDCNLFLAHLPKDGLRRGHVAAEPVVKLRATDTGNSLDKVRWDSEERWDTTIRAQKMTSPKFSHSLQAAALFQNSRRSAAWPLVLVSVCSGIFGFGT